jgi:hypothetical protein
MNRADRRSMSRSHRKGHGDGCGCTALGHLVGELLCDDCGNTMRADVWMPTSARLLDTREMGASCEYCDGEATGLGTVTELFPL